MTPFTDQDREQVPIADANVAASLEALATARLTRSQNLALAFNKQSRAACEEPVRAPDSLHFARYL